MSNTKLIRAIDILLNDLGEDAVKRMKEELDLSDDWGCMVSTYHIQIELDFLKKCQAVIHAIADKDCDVEEVNFEFIKNHRYPQGNKETLRTLLNDLFSHVPEDFGDEYVDKIVQLVFDKN